MRIDKKYSWGLIILVLGYVGLVKFEEYDLISFISAVMFSLGFVLILVSYGRKEEKK